MRNLALSILIGLSFLSCQQGNSIPQVQEQEQNSSGQTNGGAICADQEIGKGDKAPLIRYDIALPGRGLYSSEYYEFENWMPGEAPFPAIPKLEEAKAAFATDTKFRIKIKVKEKPTTCSNQKDGSADSDPYTKLKFKVSLRRVINGVAEPYPYHTRTIGPISVNNCSPIISDLPIPGNGGEFVVEVHDVQSDFACQWNNGQGHHCPVEGFVRSQSCYRMIIFAETDFTNALN